MSFATGQITVAATATSLMTGLSGWRAIPDIGWLARVWNAGDATIFVGASGVTTSTGIAVPPQESAQFFISGSDALYGIVAADTEPAHIFLSSI